MAEEETKPELTEVAEISEAANGERSPETTTELKSSETTIELKSSESTIESKGSESATELNSLESVTEFKSPESTTELKKEDEDDDIVEIAQVQVSTAASLKASNEEESRRITRQTKESILLRPGEMKFMADFDPSNSMRRQKKNRRRYFHPDGRPFLQAHDYDECDCLNQKCPGCHFPCKNCGDARCGHECRINRRWLYESVEIEGWNKILKNQHLENFNAFDFE